MEYFLFLTDVNPYFLGFFVFCFFPHLTDVPFPSDLWLLESLQCLILELLCTSFLGNLCGSCCFIYLLFANWHFEARLPGLNVWEQLEFNASQSELFISLLLSPSGRPLLALPLSESNCHIYPTVEAPHQSSILGSSFPLISHSQSVSVLYWKTSLVTYIHLFLSFFLPPPESKAPTPSTGLPYCLLTCLSASVLTPAVCQR